MDLIYYKMLSSDYSNEKKQVKITDHKKSLAVAALGINEFACLWVPDFGIATEPGLDLKLQPWLVFGSVRKI